MGGIAPQAFYKSLLKSLLSWLGARRLRERQNLFLSSCLLQQINKFGLKGKKNWDVSILQKQSILLSTLSISWIASSCLSLSLLLSNIFLTDLAYNGVNDKIEVTDKSIMESV